MKCAISSSVKTTGTTDKTWAANLSSKSVSRLFTGVGRELLDRTAEKLGISRSAVMEMAVRMIAEREGIRIENEHERKHIEPPK